MHYTTSLSVAALAWGGISSAQVVGEAYGFAAGTTGGGDAEPVYPADIDELKSLLADDEPRVIMIDKEFNFIGSEGTVTETGCRFNDGSCTSENGGQDTIKTGGCDANESEIQVTYDKASYIGMDVGSNKSIVGVGDQGVLYGKGLRLGDGVSNVIIQNIHIDNLNPQYVWGGDALSLNGANDGVWIDHVKLSRTGRQHFVCHYTGNRVTISNTEFDGVTEYSNSCNGDTYWTIIIGGDGDQITMDGNYLHDVSGRAPKIGSSSGTQLVQASNNYFKDGTGHNFDVSSSGHILIEGNAFENCNTPITDQSDGIIFDAEDGNTCSSYLGRSCQSNQVQSSGALPSETNTDVLSEFANYLDFLVTPYAASDVPSTVAANAGIGKIGNFKSPRH